jgi:transcriptional regulator with XRE-family HTH domain
MNQKPDFPMLSIVLEGIGERLQKARTQAGLNSRDAGHFMGIAHSTVTRCENVGHEESITLSHIIRAAEVYQVDWYWLATGQVPSPEQWVDRVNKRIDEGVTLDELREDLLVVIKTMVLLYSIRGDE